MNAFIAAVLDKKTILVANEGRLLKKSFLGIAILAMAFQTNNFGEMVRGTLVDAYLQVSVFVGFTLFIFIGMDALTRFNISSILDKTKKLFFKSLPSFATKMVFFSRTAAMKAFIV